ncbi:hypothetical protein Adt_35263 [Abeliophyllum distichum]|uniref:Uncharacterized protein n=1 Tax=Abeliophyllum distichum TaxID=126358 RepID=A0ABD1QE83_9LAMI
MAPKRKDPPTKKGKEKVGSSSSRRQLVETNVDDRTNFNHAIEEPEADHRYTTWVRGKWIKYSPAVIADYYGLFAKDIEPISANLDMTQVTQFLYGRADAWTLVGPKFLHNQLTESLVSSISLCVTTSILPPTCASGRSPMFHCLVSALCLAEGVSLLPHEEPEAPEPPVNKWTLGHPTARRAADNLAAETDHLLRQIFTQLSEQGWVLSSI